ncbi:MULTISPECIES: DUF4064 domain-containing protein [Planococcus]|uniref:DUF4064 domain-containing protein n=2 Tax=Planococcus TaxID=1372 RepID=A0ABM5WZQ8_9BACL|nr:MULTISPECIES: DUF4064 domain-containing protein [Planococcus]ALS79765.1 hypothetical protein AUO94_14585 [Planococcus kocurii]AQU78249.1 hypothetical protein AJGP001_02515 [Planococcus faecalis]MDJ0332817.1 DUF4064 domain-containing protein [Planococcus sp. S3-L1]OHX53831.1 hypothetical protein BB777_08960 [Planococcus faecalis]
MIQNTVNRAGEKVLGIIGIVFNILAMALIGFAMVSYSTMPEMRQFMEEEMLADPTITNPEDVQLMLDMMSSGFNVVGWVTIALLALSTILAIVALINLRKKGKASIAGVFFIIAGLFAGLLSLTSILFYIAAIMCFVRKPRIESNQNLRGDDFKYQEDQLHRKEDSLRNDDTKIRNDDDTPYRPL